VLSQMIPARGWQSDFDGLNEKTEVHPVTPQLAQNSANGLQDSSSRGPDCFYVNERAGDDAGGTARRVMSTVRTPLSPLIAHDPVGNTSSTRRDGTQEQLTGYSKLKEFVGHEIHDPNQRKTRARSARRVTREGELHPLVAYSSRELALSSPSQTQSQARLRLLVTQRLKPPLLHAALMPHFVFWPVRHKKIE